VSAVITVTTTRVKVLAVAIRVTARATTGSVTVTKAVTAMETVTGIERVIAIIIAPGLSTTTLRGKDSRPVGTVSRRGMAKIVVTTATVMAVTRVMATIKGIATVVARNKVKANVISVVLSKRLHPKHLLFG
jgi:hypothetical protein